MGQDFSTPDDDVKKSGKTSSSGYSEFLSSAGKTIGEASGIVCGSLNDTFEHDENNMRKLDADDLLCGGDLLPLSPPKNSRSTFKNPEDDMSVHTNPMSALFARALVSEVTDNPATMRPADMAAREKKLMKAQQKAKTATKNNLRAIGGQGTMKGHIDTLEQNTLNRIKPLNPFSDNRVHVRGDDGAPPGKHRVTIGLMLSRRDSKVGHSDSITRQTAFDFNELQDRHYKYVSSTDASGWRAGGGESGKILDPNVANLAVSNSYSDDTDMDLDSETQAPPAQQQATKMALQDTVHIPIIHIDCESPAAIDAVIAALARGEVFIPHMSVLPDSLGVNGVSPPDLVVRFGCERNDDLPPEQWPNWCLEFMHNQLYEYFKDMGAQWMKRPFQITLARKVRWKTMKHMNKFFSHSEKVINTWREKGPQYLDPQPSYIEGGASPEEVARPHGIYLLRNGKPTNYFAPNFDPPYTTKMTRSLLLNVMGKSWDRKRRDWSGEPLARVTTSLLLSTMCGCADANDGGFIAREATAIISPYNLKGNQSHFGDKTNASPSRRMSPGRNLTPSSADYSPFKKNSKNVIQPKAQDDQKHLYEGLKVKREDSGIRRSQLNSSDNKESPSRQRESVQNEKTESRDQHRAKEGLQKNNSNKSTTEKTSSMSSNDYDDDLFDMDRESQDNFFSPSQKKTPTTNNKNSRKTNKWSDMNSIASEESASGSLNQFDSNMSNLEENINRATIRSQSSMNHEGISVAESQTTVPIMNGSSAKFIEQERLRRKERELQREKEREKMDQLERAIEEKKKINQDRLVSTPERQELGSSNDEKESTERKSSKKEKKAKKEKKKREKKERRERSKDSRTPKKMDNNNNAQNVDWGLGSSSQQSVKENFPISPNNSKQPVGWTNNDGSYLPVNLNGGMVADSPSSKHSSIFNSNASSNAPDLHSQASLDYSLDTAGDGSLIGGQFAGDASVFTMNTSASDNKSLFSYVTRSTVHDMAGKNKNPNYGNALGQRSPTSETSEDMSLSLMASTSDGMEIIPTDEELFAIGWAKAMDPNSGSYYYFTLDRSKTVWDNPLSSNLDS